MYYLSFLSFLTGLSALVLALIFHHEKERPLPFIFFIISLMAFAHSASIILKTPFNKSEINEILEDWPKEGTIKEIDVEKVQALIHTAKTRDFGPAQWKA